MTMDPYLILLILSYFGSVVLEEYISPHTSDDIQKGSLECEASKIPIIDEFNMQKFSGVWYEIAKTVPGYMDLHSGAWRITVSNVTGESKFLFVGRDPNDRCIRPTSGTVHSSDSNPGILTLKYRTYSTYVNEHIRVLFTDYVSTAVLYACSHTNSETKACHPAGLFGSIWMRKPRAGIKTYENAVKILQRACIDKSKLQLKNIKDPCDFGTQNRPVPNYCYESMDPGTCNAEFQRFFYDPKTKQCKTFIFSGCNGNFNNFFGLRDCENHCMDFMNKPTCETEAPCALSCAPCCSGDEKGCVKCTCGSEEGYCLENSDECPKECTPKMVKNGCYNCICLGGKTTDIVTGSGSTTSDPLFIDHCRSNPNECLKECKPEKIRNDCYHCICEGDFIIDEDYQDEIPSVCFEVKDRGLCGNVLKRFYFDVISDSCEKFNYTGCGGNKNNFLTFLDCEMKCKGGKLTSVKSYTLPDEGDSNSGPKFKCLLHLLVLVITLNMLR